MTSSQQKRLRLLTITFCWMFAAEDSRSLYCGALSFELIKCLPLLSEQIIGHYVKRSKYTVQDLTDTEAVMK